MRIVNKIKQLNIGANILLVKREAGENPARSRRCNRGALLNCHRNFWKVNKAVILKSEDLPIFLSHLTLR